MSPDWVVVLRLLGVGTAVGALPAVVGCPLCRAGQLWLYPDRESRAVWHHCAACGSFGDMIGLAASYWKLDTPGAISRLREETGQPRLAHGALDAYLAAEHARYEDAAWWRRVDVSRSPRRAAAIAGLARAAGLLPEHDRAPVPADFFGLCAVDSPRQELSRAGVAIPFHGAPGQPRGVLLATAEPIEDNSRFVQFHRARRVLWHDPGVAFLAAARQPPSRPLGNTLFVMTEPWLALRMHLRWLRANQTPLPLLASLATEDRETSDVWTWLRPPRAVFCGQRLSPRLFRQAAIADSFVSRHTTDDARRHPPLQWLREADRTAEPWQIALREVLSPLSDLDAAAFLSQAALPAGLREVFVRDCPTALRRRLGVETLRKYVPTVRGALGVVEAAGAWHGSDGALICDAVIEIGRIIGVEGDTYYEGVIRYRGRDVEFLEPATRVHREGLLAAAARVLLDRGVGALRYSPAWNRVALSKIALPLHPPELDVRETRIGWDERTGRFHMPRFSLAQGGGVTPHPPSPVRLPARELRPPEALPDGQWGKVCRLWTNERRVWWAMFAATVHNILAKPLGASPRGLAITGHGATDVVDVFRRALGVSQRSAEACPDQAAWPYYFPRGFPKESLRTWLDQPVADNAFVILPPRAALAWHTHGALLLRSHEPIGMSRMRLTELSRLLPAYLQDLFSRRMGWLPRESPLATVVEDVALWCDRRARGGSGGVREALEILSEPSPRSPAESLVDIVSYLEAEGGVTGVVEEETCIRVPCAVVRSLRDEFGICPNLSVVEESLTYCGALIRGSGDAKRYWRVDSDWWRQQRLRWSRLQGDSEC